MSRRYAPGASFFSVYPHLSFLTMPTRPGLPVTGKASQNIKMYSRSRVIRNRSSRHHGMKQQHQVLLQQRHLLVVREPSGVGPFGGALHPRLLRLVPLRQNRLQGVRRERPRLYSQKGLVVRRTSSQLSGFLAYSCCCLLCDSHWARRRSRRSGGWTSISSAASSTTPSLPQK